MNGVVRKDETVAVAIKENLLFSAKSIRYLSHQGALGITNLFLLSHCRADINSLPLLDTSLRSERRSREYLLVIKTTL